MSSNLQKEAGESSVLTDSQGYSDLERRSAEASQTWANAEPIRVVSGRIPDFLGGVPATAAEGILAWPSDLGSIRAAIEAFQTGTVMQSARSAALRAAGILDGQLRLSDVGKKFAYHLHEYQRQAGGDGVLSVILEKAGLDAESRLLDVGCGAGQTLLLLGLRAPTKRIGLDIDLESLALGSQLAGEAGEAIDFVRGAASALPFRDGYFSHVLSRVTLNYVHQRTALAEQVRVLQPGGFLYCRAEGPGYDLYRLARVRRLRPVGSFCYDFLLGMALAATGRQATPGRLPAPGRAFATRGRLTRFLRRQGCTVLHAQVSARYLGLPAAIELLAQKRGSVKEGHSAPE